MQGKASSLLPWESLTQGSGPELVRRGVLGKYSATFTVREAPNLTKPCKGGQVDGHLPALGEQPKLTGWCVKTGIPVPRSGEAAIPHLALTLWERRLSRPTGQGH